MHNLVGARRNDVFLDQHLDPVRHRLKKTKRAHAIWSVAILNASENFSLQNRDERKEDEKNGEEAGDIDQGGNNLHDPLGSTGQGRKEMLFRANENLVEHVSHRMRATIF